MTLRRRLILLSLFLAIVTIGGAGVIVLNIRTLVRNQEMIILKDSIFHQHERARLLMQESQSLLYQHQAGYTRDIDTLINNISEFEKIIISIPEIYRRHWRAGDCLRCHPDGRSRVEALNDSLDEVRVKLARYKENVSVLITTNDRQAMLLHHGIANQFGAEILETIARINESAALMINQLRSDNQELFRRSVFTVELSIMIAAVLAILAGGSMLHSIDRMVHSLVTGTDSITRDDFSFRLPQADRRDEFGLIASRLNVMAEHLDVRDREIQEKGREVEEANRRLRELNDTLETRISERTYELEKSLEQVRATTTALEESKRKLEGANLDLIKANRAKSNFLSIVSHELKTPLSVINGFLSLILDERYQNDPKNMVEAVQISKRRGEQLARMIDELIDLSRLDAQAMVIHREAVDVAAAFQDVAEQFSEELVKTACRLTFDHPPEPCSVSCDPDKFRQVLTNLVSNALKFSPEGAEITVGCLTRKDDTLFFCRDQGIGITPEEKEKIFEKFYQVDSSATRRFGGAGLGLSICREIVLLHGGKIWVENNEGGGSVFYFTIPANETPLSA